MAYRKLLSKLVLSIAIAVFFLWLAIDTLVEDASTAVEGSLWEHLVDAMGAVPLGTLSAYCLIFLAVHLARVIRWQYLVFPLGERDAKKIFRICAVGFSAIVILPLRIGELVRPYLLARESDISMSAAVGSAVVERVLDGLLITGLLFVALAVQGGEATDFVLYAGTAAAAIFSGASLLLVLAAARHDLMVGLLESTMGRLSDRLCRAVLGLVDGFLDGVRVLRRTRVLPQFLAFTLLYWGLNGFGMWVLARGFGFDLGLWEAYGVLAILVVGIMIPAGPGFFGNFQLFLLAGLSQFAGAAGVAGASGLAFALVLNVLQFVLQVGFGVPFFLASQVGFRQLIEAGESSEESQ